MKSNLLKSFFIVAGFWHLVFTLFWGLGDPAANLAGLRRIAEWMPFLNLDVPAHITVLDALSVQLKVLQYWTLPMLGLTALSSVIGASFIWKVALRRRDERLVRELGSDSYRTVTSTLGELPIRAGLRFDATLEMRPEDNELLQALSERELKLLTKIIATLSAYPDAYATPGDNTNLLDFAVTLVERALELPKYAALTAIVVAALEMGKITAFAKQGVDWVQTKDIEKEAGKHLAAMDEWYALPQDERVAVMLAVTYFSNYQAIPDLRSDVGLTRLAKELLFSAAKVKNVVIAEVKAQTIDRVVQEARQAAAAPVTPQNTAAPRPVPVVAPVQPPVPTSVSKPTPMPNIAETAPRGPMAAPVRDAQRAPAPMPSSTSRPVPAPAPAPAPSPISIPQHQPAPVAPSVAQPGYEAPVQGAQVELSDVIFNAFMDALPQLPFQSKGLPKGVKAVAWKIGSRVYLLEIKLRETVMATLPADLSDALTPSRDRPRVQPFTKELLKAFQARKWLVTSLDGTTLRPEEAMWNLNAGTKPFKGVIIIDVPEEYVQQLPPEDTSFALEITGPWLTSAVEPKSSTMSRQDLLSLAGVLKPADSPEK